MPITNTLALGSLVIDDVWVYNQPPIPTAVGGVAFTLAGTVGTATWGKTNTPIGYSDTASLYENFGNLTQDAYSLVTEGTLGLLQNNNFIGVRVTDGTDVAATMNIVDNTGFGTQTIVVGGTYASGVPLTITLTPLTGPAVVISYTTTIGDATLAGIASSLVTQINNSTAVNGPTAFLQKATNATTTITVTSILQGTTVNTIGVTATGTGVTLTPGGATLTGGAAAGIIGTLTAVNTGSRANLATYRLDVANNSATATIPVYRLTINFPGGPVEIFDNLVAGTGSGYAAATFRTSLTNAINNGVQTNRPKSKYWVFSTGASSVAPYLSTLLGTSSNGTDGVAVTSAQMLGVDGTSRTGMYALRGTGVQQFILCGNTDSTIWSTMAAFAQSEISMAICALPSGTDVPTAKATKISSGLQSINAALVKDWVYFYDPVAAKQRLVSPLGAVLGIIASLQPEQSPGNKPRKGLTGLIDTEKLGVKYSDSDRGDMTANGILWMSNGQMPRRGNLMGLPHGQNTYAVANSGQDTILYTRMSNFISLSILSMLGPFVDELQGTDPDDDTRRLAGDTLKAFFGTLKRNKRIAAFSVIMDLTNNTLQTIAQGYLIGAVVVQLLNGARFVFVTSQVGANVQVAVARVQ